MTQEERLATFQCIQCGACCRWTGHVLLTEEDVTRLACATGQLEETFIEQYTELAVNRRQLTLTEHPDGRCIFLQKDRCLFYEARPEQCRSFPHAWRVTDGCPALAEMDKNQLNH